MICRIEDCGWPARPGGTNIVDAAMRCIDATQMRANLPARGRVTGLIAVVGGQHRGRRALPSSGSVVVTLASTLTSTLIGSAIRRTTVNILTAERNRRCARSCRR